MALTTTTASAAIAATDTTVLVASASGFAAGNLMQVEQEWMQILSTYDGTSTVVPVRRMGINGSTVVAHPTGVNITTGAASDFGAPSTTVVTAYPLSGLRRKHVSYSASGAIALPTSGEDMVVVLNGTSTLAMTIANPPKDIDGSIVYIIGNGKSASTIDFDDTVGLQGAGSSYDTITFQNNNQGSLAIIASNGAWLMLTPPVSGTTTNLTIAIA